MSLVSFLQVIRTLLQGNDENSSAAETPGLGERVAEVIQRTWDLGFTSFGGPPVHFQILHRRFVNGKGRLGSKWIDEQTYQELFAVCQALPGPASTKMLFCIAMMHAGLVAAIVTFLIWSIPGAAVMYTLSLGVQKLPDSLPPVVYALLSGTNASTVGLIALAAVQLAEKCIRDRITRILVIFGACAGLCYNALWYFPLLMVCGGLSTVIWDVWLRQRVAKLQARWAARRRTTNREHEAEQTVELQIIPPAEQLRIQNPEEATRRTNITNSEPTLADAAAGPSLAADRNQHRAPVQTSLVAETPTYSISIKTGLSIIAGFLISFTIIMVVRGTVDVRFRAYDLFTNMYLAGTVIFGGGPVVVPLLRSYVVDPGWVSPRDFLIGLAIIQAMPGPNFNFSVYLGALALSSIKVATFVGAMLSFVGIFLPGIALTVGVQSLWQVMRTKAWVLSLLRGINAAAVGLVFTAVYRLWEIGYLTPESSRGKSLALEPWWVVVATLAYAETAWFGVPPALAIIFGSVLGIAWYGAVKT